MAAIPARGQKYLKKNVRSSICWGMTGVVASRVHGLWAKQTECSHFLRLRFLRVSRHIRAQNSERKIQKQTTKNKQFTHPLVHHNQVHGFEAFVRGLCEASFTEKRADRDIGELEVFLLQKGEGREKLRQAEHEVHCGKTRRTGGWGEGGRSCEIDEEVKNDETKGSIRFGQEPWVSHDGIPVRFLLVKIKQNKVLDW